MEQTPKQEKQETLCYLELERTEWLEKKAKADRAGGMDARLNGEFDTVNARMNHLLEDLFAQTVTLEQAI